MKRETFGMTRRLHPCGLFLALSLGTARAQPASVESPDKGASMQQVHARFTGRPGTFAQFGDSITVTMAFWAPLPQARKNASTDMEKAFRLVSDHMRPECWRGWKGPSFGSDGSRTVRWAHQHMDEWLRTLNPEVALVMFGSNDVNAMTLEEYQTTLRAVVQKCLANGTIVILSTSPPRTGFVDKSAAFAQAVRQIARELEVPLIDFHAQILQRRPDDWDGSLPKFSRWDGYDVPTLLARDGVHPSLPKQFENDYSEEALHSCGYSLRNSLVLLKYAEVIERVLKTAKNETPRSAPAAPIQPWFPKAPPLPLPKGETVSVSNVEELFAAVDQVRPGVTILLADGHYRMPRYLEIRHDNVTVRSASGQRERVILDGAQSSHGELLGITRCSGVTIADLTIQNIRNNGFKLNSDSNVQQITIYNCLIHNVWQRGVKGVKVPAENREARRPKDCRIQYCLFYNDRPKQFTDDPTDTAASFNGNYVGGIDVMFAKNWVISDNVFVGIQGRTREARGAVFLWHDTQDCVVERNIIIDCDTGIALGNSSRPQDIAVHCTRCIVRNNFVTRAPQSGVLADYTLDCQILHNTVHDPESRLSRLIRLVHGNDGLLVANNLLSGPPMRVETQSQVRLHGNLTQDLTAAFVNAPEGNLHLKASVPSQVKAAENLPAVSVDIDTQLRSKAPDVGADEFDEALLDDIIFFEDDPAMPQETEPFPNRVIFHAAFDTGIDAQSKAKYWPGEFEVATSAKGAPHDSYWGVAQAVLHKETKGKWIRLEIKPPRPVGAQTKLRFRYFLSGNSALRVQVFDVTDQDNRHIDLNGLKEGAWQWAILDFTNDAKRNDGRNTPFAAGHQVDDLFFFVKPEKDKEVQLYVDEVTLFDAGKTKK